MGKAIDLTGMVFGRLTAIKDIGSRSSCRLWLFSCSCGNTKELTSSVVRAGHVSSCGCLQSEKISARTTRDISGMRFGRLSVSKRFGVDKHGKVLWLCLCDCGASKVLSGNVLRRPNGTRSCGCLRKDVAAATQRAKALPAHQREINRKIASAKQRARRRNDPFAAMQSRISRLHRFALNRVGAIKTSPTLESLGYTASDLVSHIERQFVNGMGWDNMREWHIDHIIPSSTAKTEADVVALNQLSNLRPMWARENIQKRNLKTFLL